MAPGFPFKNQRQGRSPPNIELLPLNDHSSSLCPVNNLRIYLHMTGVTGNVVRGSIFRNSRSDRPLLKSTLSKIICDIIEEADPGKFPRTHDTRKYSTSLAWTRGLDPTEISKRAFWRSTSVFVDRYLSHVRDACCVALNTR